MAQSEPDEKGGVMTPIVKIVVRQYDIFTVDRANKEELQGVGDTPEKAQWLAECIAGWHNVPLEVQS